MKFGRSVGFLFLISSVTLSELSAKGGKQLVLNLPNEERITYCRAKIETKQEEMEEIRAFLPERVKNLERQIQNYVKIQDALLEGESDEILSAMILSMKTAHGMNANVPNRHEKDETLDDELIAIMLSTGIWDAEKANVPNREKEVGLKEEVKNPNKQTPKLWGENLINASAKYLLKIREDKLNQLIIENRTYKDVKEHLENVVENIEDAQLQNGGNPLPQYHPLVKLQANLENDREKYINKLNIAFPDQEKIIALKNQFGLSAKQATLLFDVIMGDKDNKDPEVILELYDNLK